MIMSLPPALPGFQTIRRHWSPEHNKFIGIIECGQFYVTKNPEDIIMTTLGSCISVCIRDPLKKIGGMNHFMLPMGEQQAVHKSHNQHLGTSAARYGNWAMEFLINELMKQGSKKSHFEIKVVGGCIHYNRFVSEKNIEFVLDYFEEEGLEVVVKDVGGPYPRKVIYYPDTGKMMIKRLDIKVSKSLEDQENSYMNKISTTQTTVENDIELF